MNWNTGKPEGDGYYWYLPSGDEREEAGFERCRAVVLEISGDFAHAVGSLHRNELTDLGGFWSGPLETPLLPAYKCLQCGWEGDESELFMVPLDDEAEQAIANRKACPKCRSIALELR